MSLHLVKTFFSDSQKCLKRKPFYDEYNVWKILQKGLTHMQAFSRKYEIFLGYLLPNCYPQRKNQYGKYCTREQNLRSLSWGRKKIKRYTPIDPITGMYFGTRISVSHIYNEMYKTPIVGKYDDVCNSSGEILAQKYRFQKAWRR